MLDIKMTVVHGDDRYVVAPTMATYIAAEAHFKTPVPSMFAEGNVSLTNMAWIAWEQTRADGMAVKPFPEWVKGLVDIEMENDADPLDETT